MRNRGVAGTTQGSLDPSVTLRPTPSSADKLGFPAGVEPLFESLMMTDAELNRHIAIAEALARGEEIPPEEPPAPDTRPRNSLTNRVIEFTPKATVGGGRMYAHGQPKTYNPTRKDHE